MLLPSEFDEDGVLPPGDYELTVPELRSSMLVVGPTSALPSWDAAYNLIAEDRAHFVVPADYTDGSQLDVTIKGILGRIARDHAGYRPDANAK